MASTSKINPDGIDLDNDDLHLSNSAINCMKDEYNDELRDFFSSTQPDAGEKYLKNNLTNKDLLDIFVERTSTLEDNSLPLKNDFDAADLNTAFVDGKERLLMKNSVGKYKVVIPREELFDVVWRSHKENGHPKPEILMEILQENYVMNKFTVYCINEVCLICTGEAKPYARCALDILPMTLNPDFAFTTIMVYEDMYTGFMHFRPLSVDTVQTEICIKLLRIFMDFGPPKKLVISNGIFRNAIDQLQKITMSSPFHVKIREIEPNMEKINPLIKRVMTWMTVNESIHWAIGCYALQLEVNNKISEQDQKSPFTKVFRSLNNTIKFTDEDLEGIYPYNEIDVAPLSPAANSDEITGSLYPGDEIDVAPLSPATDSDETTDSLYPGDVDDVTNPTSSDEDIVELDAKDPLAID